MIKALFLDLDNTLLDSSRFPESLARTCECVAQKLNGIDPAYLLSANRKVWDILWPDIVEDWAIGRLTGRDLSHRIWQLTLQRFGCDDDFLASFASLKHLKLARETWQLYDDVPELFRFADDARVPMALVTNGASDTQRDKLRVLGIDGWFDAFAVSGEVGARKPLADIFASALECLGVHGKDVWHVGDSLESDVAGARAAGLTAVWINRYGAKREPGDPEPDMEIRSLSELASYF